MSKLLLDILQPDLGNLLDQTESYEMAEKFLNQILSNDELFLLEQNIAHNSTDSTPTIVEEIAELDSKQHNLATELQQLTAANKEIIIDIADTISTVQKENLVEFATKTKSIANIIQSSETRNKFAQLNVPEKYYASIETNNSILNSIDPVLDILELPSLCKLCVLRGNYQETLEILTMVQSLIIRFPAIEIFRTVYAQVEQELQTMLTGLVKLLSGNIKQNNILKIFQILMKLNLNKSFQSKQDTTNYLKNRTYEAVDQGSRISASSSSNTTYLQMLYLNSRFLFILKEVEALVPLIKFNKLTYLKRYIETYREHLFNTLSCYYTIFGKFTDETQDSSSLLINQFVRKLVDKLVQELDKFYREIPSEDDVEKKANEDGLLLQVIYFSRSLSKYKVDCEAALVYELIFNKKLISEDDWARNLKKVKKLR